MSPTRAAQVFGLLADESRLRLLTTLSTAGELPVTALAASLGAAQPAVSHHLALLRLAGVVSYRRQGKSNFYSLASEIVRELLRAVKY